MNTFAATCMENIGHLSVLPAKMDKLNMPEFPPAKASGFLMGGKGRSWMVKTAAGNFAVSMAASKDLCSISAQNIPAGAAQQAFDRQFRFSADGIEAQSLPNQLIQDGRMMISSVQWTAPNMPFDLLFTFTTSANPQVADRPGVLTVRQQPHQALSR